MEIEKGLTANYEKSFYQLTLKWLNRLVNTPFDRTKLLTDANLKSLLNEPRFRELIENKKN